MNKELKKKTKEAAKKEQLKLEDVKFYRLMVEFILSVFIVYGVIQAGNNKIYIAGEIAPILILVSGIIFAATAVWAVFSKMRGRDEKYKVITSAGLFGNAAVLFFSCAHFRLFMKPDVLLLSLIIAALLYFVYSIYSKNFFIYSLSAGAGFMALLHANIDSDILVPFANVLVYVSQALAFAIPLAAAVYAAVMLSRRTLSGKVAVSVIVAALIILAGAVLTLLYPVAVVYTEFTLLAVYLITAVSYTVKLM